MTLGIYLCIYIGFVIFLAGCIRRVVQYARTPVHLRWELYPVPHEEPGRVAHGGSYFESSDWWTHPRHFNLSGELRAMVPEIVFLKGLWEFNRKLWYPSFLFHFGLYCTIASVALVIAQAIMSAIVAGWAGGIGGHTVSALYHVTGYAALVLTLAGAVRLLWRRVTDPELKNFTSPADIFNLAFFILTYCLLGAGYFSRPSSVTEITGGLLRFDLTVQVSPLLGLGLVLACALVAYIPFTHMAHFIAKYFTYHAVRWDDRINPRGGRIEAAVAGYLAYKPNWSAAHMGATGEKTWAEIATTNPALAPPAPAASRSSQEVRR
jgi:nitrate reductase gamma subunit